jgi:hypothetical protein
MSNVETKTRGRKSVIPKLDKTQHIVLQQHHFKYSDDFAELLSKFSIEHLDSKSKDFKRSWQEWTNTNIAIIQREKEMMKSQGYEGSVDEKMYFSARYYYRKKAIREQNEAINMEDKLPRKKYESVEKQVLTQMSDHIILQISRHLDVSETCVVSNMTPSKAFANYCKTYNVSEDDAKTKKTYKNIYWRISKQTKK